LYLELLCEVILGNGPALAALLALGHSQGSLQWSVLLRKDDQRRIKQQAIYRG